MIKLKRMSFLLLLLWSSRILAATFEVDTHVDVVATDDFLSLREAIQAANDTPGKDVIVMADTLDTDITLSNGEFTITDDVEIDGSFTRAPVIWKNSKSPGIPTFKTPIIIDANNASRVFEIAGDSGTVEIREMILRNGMATLGGGILMNAIGQEVTLRNITISGCAASSDGGAIVVFTGQATLIDCTIENNRVQRESGSGFGGGIATLATLEIIDTEIIGNRTDGSGGGIHSSSGGEISLIGSVIADNTAEFRGGGISSAGTITASGISVIRNHSDLEDSTLGGGGLENNGSATIENSTFESNTADSRGGGVYSREGATFDAARIVIVGNRSEGDGVGDGGGGIYNAGSATIVGSRFELNTAGGRLGQGGPGGGGGIHNLGSLTLTDSTLVSNEAMNSKGVGGGVLNDASGQLEINGSSISDNTAELGGGLFNEGTFSLLTSTLSTNNARMSGGGILSDEGTNRVRNCTFSGNRAQVGSGGGISSEGVSGEIAFLHTTIAANHAAANGGGIAVSAGTVEMGNTIVANNTTGGVSPDLFGILTSLDFNLIGDTSNAAISGPVVNSILDTDAQIGPLADNGGLTLTHDLLTGSPAIDAGSVGFTSAEALTEDQRGFTRIGNIGTIPDAGGGVDIGAVEVIGLSILDGAAMEDTGQIVMNISLSHGPPPGEIATVDVNTFDVDGGASQGIDYSPIESQRVTFTSTGPFLQPLSIPVSVDNDPEPNEVFEVRLSNAVGATIIDASAFGTILNDDSGPTATPTPAGTPTPTNPTDYDVRPIPPDGIINALDLIEWYTRVQDGSPEAEILFDFARFWDSR